MIERDEGLVTFDAEPSWVEFRCLLDARSAASVSEFRLRGRRLAVPARNWLAV